MEKAFPKTIATMNHTQSVKPYYLLLNNGFIRGPIYKGEFTKDDERTSIAVLEIFRTEPLFTPLVIVSH